MKNTFKANKKNPLNLLPGYFGRLLALVAIIGLFFPASGQSWNDLGTAGISPRMALYTSIAIDPSGTPYVAFEDSILGKATVMKYNGTSWVLVGTAGFTAGTANYLSLAIDGSGTPYLAFQDYASSSKATVMKYSGGSWVTVGTSGFSPGNAHYLSLAIDPSGNPWLVFDDGTLGGIAVMEYTGGSWNVVGGGVVSAGSFLFTTLAIDYSGTPYVGYEDLTLSGRATVMKYNGTAWVNVGTPGFSTAGAGYPSIAIDGVGKPFLAFTDNSLGNKATVMDYVGGAWAIVGTAGFTADTAIYNSLKIDGSGKPYLAYKDAGYGDKATVMKFNGTSWAAIGSAGFSAGQVNSTALALNSCGVPFVVYEDFANHEKATVMTLGPGPITGTLTLCAGATTTLSDAICNGTWSSSNLSVATVGSVTGIVTGVAAGTAIISYELIGIPVFTTVTVNPLPVADTIAGPSVVCLGTAITLTDASGGGTWSSSNIAKATVGTTGVVSGVTVGSVTISYTVTNICGSAYATRSLSIGTMPVAGTISGTTYMCQGSTLLLTETAGGGVWSSGTVAVATIGSTGLVSGISGGTSVIYYVVTNSCGSVMAVDTLTIHPLPDPGIITGPHSLCIGDSASISDSIPGGIWHSSSVSTVPVNTMGMIHGVSAGTAVISYTTFNSCGPNSATDTITVYPIPNPGTISGIDSLCPGDTLTLSETAGGGMWGTTDTLITRVMATGLITGSMPGTDSVTYTVIIHGCSATAFYPFLVSGFCPGGVKPVNPVSNVGLMVFPNPSSGSFTLTVKSLSMKTLSILITNMLGEKVKEFSVITNKETEVQLNVPPGVYFISAVTESGIVTEKIVVE